MPATAGRVRMPHNNRMCTSDALKTHGIWSKTIGGGGGGEEPGDEEKTPAQTAETAEKVKNVMELARTQNVTDGADREGFTAKLYLGLKRGKVRRSGAGAGDPLNSHLHGGGLDPKLRQLLDDPDSSSEEEFVEEDEEEDKRNDPDEDANDKDRESNMIK
eukprot:jgi/Psemu1/291425/fgenesh1_pg.697_\